MLLSYEKKGEEKSQEIERYLPCNLSVSSLLLGFYSVGSELSAFTATSLTCQAFSFEVKLELLNKENDKV